MNSTAESFDAVIGDLEVDAPAQAANVTCVHVYCIQA